MPLRGPLESDPEPPEPEPHALEQASRSAGGGDATGGEEPSSEERTAIDVVGHGPYPLRGALAASRLVAPCTVLDNSVAPRRDG